jgi:hypothetical protein
MKRIFKRGFFIRPNQRCLHLFNLRSFKKSLKKVPSPETGNSFRVCESI